MAIQKALYYPFPFVQNEEWLKCAALYWEQLIRIIPRRFHEAYINGKRITSPSETERMFMDEFQFIKDYHVRFTDTDDMNVPTIKSAVQLIGFLKETRKKSPELFNEMVSENREYFSWGAEENTKTGLQLAFELDELGAFDLQKKRFRESSGRLYMMFLASNISDEIGCPVITDDEKHDTLLKMSSLFRPMASDTDWWLALEGIEKRQKQKKHLEALACLNLQSVGIRNLDQVTPEKIVKFRKRYEDERFAYLDSLFNMVRALNTEEIRSETQLDLLLHDRSKRLVQKSKDIEKALKGLKLQTFPLLISLSTTIPLFSALSKCISVSGPILTVGSLAFGIVGILVRTKVESGKIFRGNRAGAYLFHLEEEFVTSDYLQTLVKKFTKFGFS